MKQLEIKPGLYIDEDELEFSAIRSQGAGGQNVNKVATAIQLRFDIASSPSLPEPLRQRLLSRGDQRVSSDGILVIKSQEHRSQPRNREAAVGRLVELLREASVVQKPRRPTRPSGAAKRKRIEEKKRRGETKKSRGKPAIE